MKRSYFRNLWLLVVFILLGSSWFLFKKAEEVLVDISRSDSTLLQLRREKNNVETLSAALNELDALTVDERNTTRLDLLRHLELETKDYTFNVESNQTQMVGDTSLHVREFEIITALPYAEAMALMDKLHSNRKVVLDSYVLEMVRKGSDLIGDYVNLEIRGSLYGLEKN